MASAPYPGERSPRPLTKVRLSRTEASVGPALLGLDLLDRDDDREGKRRIEAVGDLDAVRVMQAEPGA